MVEERLDLEETGMRDVMSVFTFCAHWLIFAFSLYQGALHISTSHSRLRELASTAVKHFPGPPRWMIVCMPLWFAKKRQQILQIVHEVEAGETSRQELLSFLDKATAWFYIALAGWINMIVALYDLFERYEAHDLWLYLLLILLATFASFANTAIRLHPKHYEHLKKRLHL